MKKLLLLAALNACEPQAPSSPLLPSSSPLSSESSVCSGFPTRDVTGKYVGHEAPTENASLGAVEAILKDLQAKRQLVSCSVMEAGRVGSDNPEQIAFTNVLVVSNGVYAGGDFLPKSDSGVVCFGTIIPCLKSEDSSCIGFTDKPHAGLLQVTCSTPEVEP